MMRQLRVGQSIEGRWDFELGFTVVVSTPELLPAMAMLPDFAWRVRVVGGCGLGMVRCSGAFGYFGPGRCVQVEKSVAIASLLPLRTTKASPLDPFVRRRKSSMAMQTCQSCQSFLLTRHCTTLERASLVCSGVSPSTLKFSTLGANVCTPVLMLKGRLALRGEDLGYVDVIPGGITHGQRYRGLKSPCNEPRLFDAGNERKLRVSMSALFDGLLRKPFDGVPVPGSRAL
jgi:hypothetical protein